jgi:hypothetical protein
VQYSLPLCGVFFLEQSEADKVVPVGEGQAAVLMTESATQVCEKFWRTLNREGQRQFREELLKKCQQDCKEDPSLSPRCEPPRQILGKNGTGHIAK